MWDKEPDGSMHELSGGGASRRRLHSARDYTGLEEMRVLRDEIRNRQITYLEFEPAVELILDDKGHAAGAVMMNLETKEIIIVKAKAVIMAAGGGGRLSGRCKIALYRYYAVSSYRCSLPATDTRATC